MPAPRSPLLGRTSHSFQSLSKEQVSGIVKIIGCKPNRHGQYSVPSEWHIYRRPTTGKDPHYLELHYHGNRPKYAGQRTWIITDRPPRMHHHELVVVPSRMTPWWEEGPVKR